MVADLDVRDVGLLDRGLDEQHGVVRDAEQRAFGGAALLGGDSRDHAA